MAGYALEGAKWSHTNVTWSFANSTYGADASDSFSSPISAQYQDAITRALQQWSSVSPLTFTEVADSADIGQAADIRVGFGALGTPSTGTIGQTDLRWDGAGNLLPDEIVRLEDPSQLGLVQGGNGTYTYAGTATTLDEVATHELGHALGPGHSSDPNAIMYASVGPNNQALDQSDIAGIQALYGAPTTTQPVAAASSGPAAADTLTLHLSEDAWQGDAQFVASLDGQQLGTAQAVTALHGAGGVQDFTYTGTFGIGPHDLAVTFLNDAWGGTASTDRNLYVNGADYDAKSVAQGDAALYQNGTVHFQVGGSAAGHAKLWAAGSDTDSTAAAALMHPPPVWS